MPVQDTENADNDLTLSQRVVAAVFDRRQDANAAVERLRESGWPNDAIGLLYQSGEDRARHRGAGETETASGATAGIAAGGALGGLAGLLAGVAAVTVPGLGLLAAAGPLVSALAGAAMGGAMGGLVGSFVGLGIPREDARTYEAAVQEGGIFVSVRTRDAAEADRAKDLMAGLGARAVNSYNAGL